MRRGRRHREASARRRTGKRARRLLRRIADRARRVRMSLRALARGLRIPAQTLHDRVQPEEAETIRPGRPAAELSVEDRARVMELIEATNGRASIAALKTAMPEVPRRVLREIRRQWRQDHDRHPHRLTWLVPGTVWAMDFTELEQPLAGGARHVLLVRDLPSGMMLATGAWRRATSRVTVGVLERLIRAHGAPMVVKSDNGSHFTARRVRKLLADRQVCHLPPLQERRSTTARSRRGPG